MVTLYELSQEVIKIREAVNSMKVEGRQNAALVVYCCDKCDGIIKAVNEAVSALSAPKTEDKPQEDPISEESPPEEEGEVNE